MFNIFKRNDDIFKINKIRYKQEFAVTHEGKLYGYLVNTKDENDILIINIQNNNGYEIVEDESLKKIVLEKIKKYL